MNLVRAELEGEAVRFAGHRVPLDPRRRPPVGSDRQLILGIRPEDFEDVRFSPPGLPTIDVQITLVEDLGPEALAFFALDTERVEPELFGVTSDRSDQEALIAGDRRALFSATLDAATDARPGASCRLTVNPARFHFFSAYNGENLLAPALEVSERLEEAV
jgi:ABC-type sugar transport system ATPase subunit